jgi:hypothetical protein
MAELRQLLAEGPRGVGDLVTPLYDDGAGARRALDALVMAGSRVTAADGTPVLSARYRLFVRATEGAFTCLSGRGPHVYLEDGTWVGELVRLLEGIREELTVDVQMFEERRQKAFGERKDYLVERCGRTINTLTKRKYSEIVCAGMLAGGVTAFVAVTPDVAMLGLAGRGWLCPDAQVCGVCGPGQEPFEVRAGEGLAAVAAAGVEAGGEVGERPGHARLPASGLSRAAVG